MTHAYEADLVCQGFVADADLSSYQYRAVEMNTDEEIVLASEGNLMLGVLQDEPAAAGRTCRVALRGITKAYGSAAIEEGANVQVTDDGKFKTYASGAYAGIAVTPCGGDGQQFSLEINRVPA